MFKITPKITTSEEFPMLVLEGLSWKQVEPLCFFVLEFSSMIVILYFCFKSIYQLCYLEFISTIIASETLLLMLLAQGETSFFLFQRLPFQLRMHSFENDCTEKYSRWSIWCWQTYPADFIFEYIAWFLKQYGLITKEIQLYE